MRTTLILTLLALGATPMAAQHAKASQAKMLEHERKWLLSMADSMPERLYRDKATPAQRDFAQQVHHAASAAAYIASISMGGAKPSLPDTASAFASRAGLRRYITAAFDYMDGLLSTQTEAARGETVTVFGQSMPRWQVWDEIYTHTAWTAGQVVANFRKNGMAPPAFSFF